MIKLTWNRDICVILTIAIISVSDAHFMDILNDENEVQDALPYYPTYKKHHRALKPEIEIPDYENKYPIINNEPQLGPEMEIPEYDNEYPTINSELQQGPEMDIPEYDNKYPTLYSKPQLGSEMETPVYQNKNPTRSKILKLPPRSVEESIERFQTKYPKYKHDSMQKKRKPKKTGTTFAKKLQNYIKQFLNFRRIRDVKNDLQIYGVKYSSGTRKNDGNKNLTAIIILTPRENPVNDLIPPGYTLFRPPEDTNLVKNYPRKNLKSDLRSGYLKKTTDDEEEDEKKKTPGVLGVLKDLFHIGHIETNTKIIPKGLLNFVVIAAAVPDEKNKTSRQDKRTKPSRPSKSLGQSNPSHPSLNSYPCTLQRRSVLRSGDVILGAPTRPEHLPQALPIHPGHTLLRPTRGMLKSAVKYPLRDFGGSAVYGNLDNVGITLGKTRNRIRYTDFRKSNDVFLKKLLNAVQSNTFSGGERNHPLIVVEIDPSEFDAIQSGKEIIIQDANAAEVFDDFDALLDNDNNDPVDFRRNKVKSKFRDRAKLYKRAKSSDESSDTSKSDETNEKNEGNPFTIFKNKYKQNWMWNHKFDGVHVNINPSAPQFNQLGPTGAELIYARKWWYFNQDDYKPMGRKR